MRSIIQKSQKDIVKYYNQKHTHTPVFCPDDKVFLDFIDIHMICCYDGKCFSVKTSNLIRFLSMLKVLVKRSYTLR